MADTQQPNVLDKNFFLQADDFFSAHKDCGLTYDDLSLCTLYSDILPRETQLETRLAEGIELHLPILSSDMDTVTESRMAIAMAQHGGMGLIHYNMTARDQLKEVSRVKNHVHGLITDPITVRPESLIGEVLELIERKGFTFSTFPVVDASEKLIGLLPGNVVRPRNANRSVSEALLPRNEVMTLAEKDLGNDPIAVADRVFAEHPRIDKLMVVDAQDHLRGLFTLSDVDRITHERQEQFKPARDREFRLLCGAAVSASRTSSGDLDREKTLHHVEALVERGVDAVAVSTAHGHTRGVGETV
ncbi:MAG: malate dehydrogenase, partial [Pedosphaera sp.]|nr:malate dehydrogenase [Pedosphaera sp.]